MSRTRQNQDHAVVVATFPMPPGTVFSWHTHDDHQLAWAAQGVLTVITETGTWVLPPTRALWIPAGLPHETGADSLATMRSLYISVRAQVATWTEPTPVAITPLFAELVAYLHEVRADDPRRTRAEALLADLLVPVKVTSIDVRMPVSDCARSVAEALRGDPADKRTLREWGRAASVSERTLARAFTRETQLPFSRWRTLVRLQAALTMLAKGQAVSRVAVRVGYDTPSAFIAAFRRETGVSPSAYFSPDGLRQDQPRVPGDEGKAVPG
jgi:AraC-like DNA-binding protein/quercetin dioxygenase-like cupin family protein